MRRKAEQVHHKKRTDAAIAHVVAKLTESFNKDWFDHEKGQMRTAAFTQWAEIITGQSVGEDELVKRLSVVKL